MSVETEDEKNWERAREEMVEHVAAHFEETGHQTGVSRLEDRIREAMLEVPRHRFVPKASGRLAYADSALPIGYGQTISQPFIVALMIELANLPESARVLEVGTGSGYEAALLSAMGAEVFTIEIVPELAAQTSARLADLGCERVHMLCGDGFDGWPDAAPFDAILVTACSEEIPAPLVQQLVPGGRMVIPIGRIYAYQELRVIEKTAGEDFVTRHGLPVAFVPLVHAEH